MLIPQRPRGRRSKRRPLSRGPQLPPHPRLAQRILVPVTVPAMAHTRPSGPRSPFLSGRCLNVKVCIPFNAMVIIESRRAIESFEFCGLPDCKTNQDAPATTQSHLTSAPSCHDAPRHTQNARRGCPNVVTRDLPEYGEYIRCRARRRYERHVRAAYPAQNPAANVEDRMRIASIGVVSIVDPPHFHSLVVTIS
jgi:hypothetical protein